MFRYTVVFNNIPDLEDLEQLISDLDELDWLIESDKTEEIDDV